MRVFIDSANDRNAVFQFRRRSGCGSKRIAFLAALHKIADDHIRRCAFRGAKHAFHRMGCYIIIAVHLKNPVPRRGLKPRVTCGADALICLMKRLHSGILCRPAVTNFRAPICGAIIHQKHFDIMERLVHNRGNTAIQVIRDIIDRNNHADQIHLIHTPMLQ